MKLGASFPPTTEHSGRAMKSLPFRHRVQVEKLLCSSDIAYSDGDKLAIAAGSCTGEWKAERAQTKALVLTFADRWQK